MLTGETIQALIQYNAHQLSWHQLENHEDLHTLTQFNSQSTQTKSTTHAKDHTQDQAKDQAETVMTWLDLQGEISEQRWQQLLKLNWFDPQTIERSIELYQLNRQRPSIEEYPQSLVIIFRMVSIYIPDHSIISNIDSSKELSEQNLKLSSIPHQFPELNLALDVDDLKPASRQSQEWSEGCGFRSQQVSFVVNRSYLISVQEHTDYDSFELVRDQLRVHKSLLCDRGVDYLVYALIDATIDSFFPVLEQYGERIASLEDEVVLRPTPKTLKKIYRLRRDLLELRRAVWPQRHVVNLLSRGSGDQIISEMVRACFRDAYDRLMQVLEMIESYRELTSGLMDIYLSALSQKTNEVMKTLTIISTIFIPLTFVAGVYGMNFNTDRSPWNMPELNWYWGYPLCWAIMLTIASGSIIFFWRRGWFENLSDWHDLPPSDPS